MSALGRVLAVIAGSLFASSPVLALAPADNIGLRCEAALAYARHVMERYPGGRLVFSDRPSDLIDFLNSGWWVEDDDPTVAVRAPEPTALIARLGSHPPSAVSQCPALRRLLSARHIGYGRRAVRAARLPSGRLRDAYRLIMLSLPVVSEDGRHALLDFSHSGAGESLLLLERQADGGWRTVARQPMALY